MLCLESALILKHLKRDGKKRLVFIYGAEKIKRSKGPERFKTMNIKILGAF